MKLYFAVGIGGVIGSILRYIMSILFWTDELAGFPWATFIANITGAFLLTVIIFQPFVVTKLAPVTFVALTTGLIGSYTTFSTLILEITVLFSNNVMIAFTYLCATIIGGLLASFSGYVIAQKTNKEGAT